MKKTYLFALLAGLVLLFGCSIHGSGPGSGTEGTFKEKKVSPTGTQHATKVEMAIPDVNAGDSGNIYIHYEPKDAEVYIYCDTELADFDGEGITVEIKDDGKWCAVPFKTKKAGSFTFYAKSGEKQWSENVKINPVISSIEIKGSPDPVELNGTVKLSAVTNPDGAASTIKWTSSNPAVAKVDENGLVSALKPGKVTITASTKMKPNDESDNTLVSDTFYVTVKGFCLDETDLTLYTKINGFKKTVTAITTGYSDYTIEWSSSDPNLFTVSGNGDKATLSYVDDASGEGTLTATLKKSDGTELAKATAVVYVFRYEMISLGDSISAGYAAPKMGTAESNDSDLLEEDFLAAYNKYVTRRATGSDDYDYVNEFAHPAVIRKDLKDDYNFKVRSYAKSGDQTSDLLKKLDESFEDMALGTSKGEIYEAVNDAHFITLCIGANDILHHALGVNIVTKTPAQFDKLFAESFETFKSNFDTIIQKITGKEQQVYVMSIYNPYVYLDAEHIPADQVNAETLFGFVKTQSILNILPVAKTYLDKMNAYIKEKADANPNLIFVDVAGEFNNYTAENHHLYLNVDPSRFNLAALVSKFGKVVPIWFDPHPRKLGQDKIAKLYETKLREN